MKFFRLAIIILAVGLFVSGNTWAMGMRGGGGGGGRGGHSFGGGGNFNGPGARQNFNRADVGQRIQRTERREFSRPQVNNGNMRSQVSNRDLRPRVDSGINRDIRSMDRRDLNTRLGQQGQMSRDQLKNFINTPSGNTLGKVAVGGGLAALGGAMASHNLGQVGQNLRPGGLPGPDRRPNFNLNVNKVQNIQNNFNVRHADMFNNNWWRNHPCPNCNWRNRYWSNWDNRHWWRPATWGFLVGFATGVIQPNPIIYDWGSSTTYFNNNVIFVGGQTYSPDDFYNTAAAVVQNIPEDLPEDTQWMPLGVFAITQGDQPNVDLVLQLAITNQGIIGGSYYNASTDKLRPIKGMVDKTTQRAIWRFADGKNQDIVMEAGIYNLTQEQAQALIHFGDDLTQQWTLVRLTDPQESAASQK